MNYVQRHCYNTTGVKPWYGVYMNWISPIFIAFASMMLWGCVTPQELTVVDREQQKLRFDSAQYRKEASSCKPRTTGVKPWYGVYMNWLSSIFIAFASSCKPRTLERPIHECGDSPCEIISPVEILKTAPARI